MGEVAGGETIYCRRVGFGMVKGGKNLNNYFRGFRRVCWESPEEEGADPTGGICGKKARKRIRERRSDHAEVFD